MSLLDISISETYKGLQGKACPFTEHLTHAENFESILKGISLESSVVNLRAHIFSAWLQKR